MSQFLNDMAQYCREIGADCYTPDAASAANAAAEFCKNA